MHTKSRICLENNTTLATVGRLSNDFGRWDFLVLIVIYSEGLYLWGPFFCEGPFGIFGCGSPFWALTKGYG